MSVDMCLMGVSLHVNPIKHWMIITSTTVLLIQTGLMQTAMPNKYLFTVKFSGCKESWLYLVKNDFKLNNYTCCWPWNRPCVVVDLVVMLDWLQPWLLIRIWFALYCMLFILWFVIWWCCVWQQRFFVMVVFSQEWPQAWQLHMLLTME